MIKKNRFRVILSILVSVFLISLLTISAAAELPDSWDEVDDTLTYRHVLTPDSLADEGRVRVEGFWTAADVDQAYGNTELVSSKQDKYLEFTFEGYGFRWIGSTGSARGTADVFVDEELVAEGVDLYSESSQYQQELFSLAGLEFGEHTVRIEIKGAGKGKSAHVNADAFEYIPGLEETLEKAESTLDGRVIGDNFGLYDNLEAFLDTSDVEKLEEEITEGEDLLDESVSDDEIIDRISAINGARLAVEESDTNIVFPDLSGNGNDMSLADGKPLWTPGRYDRGLYFEEDASFEIAPEAIPDGDEITVEVWHFGTKTEEVYPTLIAAYEDADKEKEEGNRTLNIHLPFCWPEFNVYFDAGLEDGEIDRLDPEITEDRILGWNHWAFTKDAEKGVMKIYHNGRLLLEEDEKEKSLTDSEIVDFAVDFHGIVDDLRIWSEERSQKEIKDTMYIPLTGEEQGLTGYWSFDSYKD